MQHKVVKNLSVINTVAIIATLVLPFFATQDAKAANLQKLSVRLDRMAANTFTSGMVCATPATTSTTTNIDVAVTFPTNYVLSPTLTDWTTSTTNIPATASVWPNISATTASNVTGQTVTWTYAVATLTAGTTYCFNWTNSTAALKTPVAAVSNAIGSVATHIAGPTLTDSAQYALSTISTGDQISISGTVNPTFTYTLSATSSNFSTIGNSVVNASSSPVVSIVTNARNGWVTWVKDANNGTLNSAGTGTNIPTPGAVGGASYNLGDAGHIASGGFGLGVTVSGGSAAADAAYNGAVAGYAGTLANTFRPIASSTTYSSADTVTLIPRVIASTTQAPANDYTDTLTVVAAGQF